MLSVEIWRSKIHNSQTLTRRNVSLSNYTERLINEVSFNVEELNVSEKLPDYQIVITGPFVMIFRTTLGVVDETLL